jgi:hypothetical protein
MPAISLRAGDLVRIPAEGATAAYATDVLYVDVTLDDGFVQVLGKFAGHTEVIIVTDGSARNVPVDVTPAAPVYPPGFRLPESTARGPVSGTYEFRYTSDQPQLQNIVDITVQGSDRTTQFHMLLSSLLAPPPGEARVFLPSAFYQIKTSRWDLALLDQTVTNSPLTVNGSILRGVHFKSKRWVFHAGYASLASFHGFIFPVQPEEVAGASYIIPLSTHSRLTSNAYYFFTPTQALTTGRPGAVPSVVYEYKRDHDLELLAELAAGSGLGSALQFRYSRPRDDFIANFRQKPRVFHSLSFDNVPGLQSELLWNRQISAVLFNNVSFSDNRLLLPQSLQNNLTSSENLHATLSKNWSVGTGAAYAAFSQTGAAGAYSLTSLTLPQNINFDLPHFGVGFQYQYTRNSRGFAAGQDFRPSFRASIGAFTASAYFERQTQATTIESIFSENPTLQAELNALGLTLSTPAQLQTLLQDTTFLQALGLSAGSQLSLVPTRNQVGGNMNWTSSRGGSQQLNMGFVYSTDHSLLTTTQNWNLTGSYGRQIGQAFNLSLSASLLHITIGGQPQTYPMVQVGLRRSFSALPWFLSSHKVGTISGTVFQDDAGHGIFRKGLPPLAGVEVVLDSTERTTTDSNGLYSFAHVPGGGHFIEFNFHSAKPFWFTGPSKRPATINVPANLGIRFASAALIGYLRNDAEVGVQGAQIIVTGTSQQLEIQSDAQGRFSAEGLGAGDYEVSVDPDSLPEGYFLQDLKPQQISLDDGVPKRLDFRVRALRSLAGHVTVYSAAAGEYIPAVGIAVELQGSVTRTTVTNSSGRFTFQDLPSGNFDVVLEWDQAEVTQNVRLPAEPGSTKVEIRLQPRKNLVAADGSIDDGK